MVPDSQVQAERRAIADGCRNLLAGRSLSDIARDWNAAGLRTPRGNPWVFDTVRETLNRATNAGLIEHGGVVVGRMNTEPIRDQDTFAAVRAFLASRRPGRTAGQAGRSGRKYLGSGIVRCGECGRACPRGGSVRARHRTEKPAKGQRMERRVYSCAVHRGGCGKVVAPVHAVDPQLRQLVIERLSDPKHAAQVSEFTSQRAQRLTEVRAAIGKCEQLQEALAERLGREEMTLAAFDAANRPVVKRLVALTAERDPREDGELGELSAEAPQEIAAEWDALGASDDVEGLRVMLRRALGQRHQVVIDRAIRRGPQLNNTRIRLHTLRNPDPFGNS